MKHVAVIRGGTTVEHQQYHASAQQVLTALLDKQHSHRDVVVTKDGRFLCDGKVRTLEQVLVGVEAALLLLPKDCCVRDVAEPALRTHGIATIGHRDVRSAILTSQATYAGTSPVPTARSVQVFVTRGLRDADTYVFPALEPIAASQTLHNSPSWMTTGLREQIHQRMQAVAADVSAPLYQARFLIHNDDVQLAAVSTDSDILFSPALKTSCEFVGLSYADLLTHLISTS